MIKVIFNYFSSYEQISVLVMYFSSCQVIGYNSFKTQVLNTRAHREGGPGGGGGDSL